MISEIKLTLAAVTIIGSLVTMCGTIINQNEIIIEQNKTIISQNEKIINNTADKTVVPTPEAVEEPEPVVKSLPPSKSTTSENMILVDYTKPISQKRLFVINNKTKEVLFSTYVSHGKNSGGDYATKLSNKVGSKMSNGGTMRVGESYIGKHGKSFRLAGLDPGVNSNAMKRAIVLHSADYMSLSRKSYFGHSWGCLSVPPEHKNALYAFIKPGMIIKSKTL